MDSFPAEETNNFQCPAAGSIVAGISMKYFELMQLIYNEISFQLDPSLVILIPRIADNSTYVSMEFQENTDVPLEPCSKSVNQKVTENVLILNSSQDGKWL